MRYLFLQHREKPDTPEVRKCFYHHVNCKVLFHTALISDLSWVMCYLQFLRMAEQSKFQFIFSSSTDKVKGMRVHKMQPVEWSSHSSNPSFPLHQKMQMSKMLSLFKYPLVLCCQLFLLNSVHIKYQETVN